MAAIESHDELYRRIFGYHIKPNGDISSAAFTNRSKKPDPMLSVHLARITDAEVCRRLGVPGQGVIALVAAVPIVMGLEVVPDPQPGDPGHCLVIGLSLKQECVRLARASRVIIVPPTPRETSSSRTR